jgi:hypothetical protein
LDEFWEPITQLLNVAYEICANQTITLKDGKNVKLDLLTIQNKANNEVEQVRFGLDNKSSFSIDAKNFQGTNTILSVYSSHKDKSKLVAHISPKVNASDVCTRNEQFLSKHIQLPHESFDDKYSRFLHLECKDNVYVINAPTLHFTGSKITIKSNVNQNCTVALQSDFDNPEAVWNDIEKNIYLMRWILFLLKMICTFVCLRL